MQFDFVFFEIESSKILGKMPLGRVNSFLSVIEMKPNRF